MRKREGFVGCDREAAAQSFSSLAILAPLGSSRQSSLVMTLSTTAAMRYAPMPTHTGTAASKVQLEMPSMVISHQHSHTATPMMRAANRGLTRFFRIWGGSSTRERMEKMFKMQITT